MHVIHSGVNCGGCALSDQRPNVTLHSDGSAEVEHKGADGRVWVTERIAPDGTSIDALWKGL